MKEMLNRFEALGFMRVLLPGPAFDIQERETEHGGELRVTIRMVAVLSRAPGADYGTMEMQGLAEQLRENLRGLGKDIELDALHELRARFS